MYKAGKKKFFIVFLTLSCFFMPESLHSQFAPGPQDVNTTAIHKDNPDFSFWATEVIIERGWQNIADTTLGKATVGNDSSAIGVVSSQVVSLGDAGSAITKFPFTIYNVAGYDFTIFENGFAAGGSEENVYFLELAKVEVSQDGINYIPFNSTSNIDNSSQKTTFAISNCTLVDNLAGKYPANYGTPFDLEELGLDSIIAVKIIDVVGSIDTNYASYDSQNNIINDPYPTPFGSSGFDLNAIGALNQDQRDTTTTSEPIIQDTVKTNILTVAALQYSIYPNPIKQNSLFFVETGLEKNTVEIFSLVGEKLYTQQFSQRTSIQTNNIDKGIYFIRINDSAMKKIMIK